MRTSLNVPLENGKVANAFRLRSSLPTIQFLMKAGARVILASHIGRADTETLRPVYDALRPMIPGITFAEEAIGPSARKAVRAVSPGGVVLLENLRRYRGETMNDPAFAKELASLADVFVQDNFDTCHREHASFVGVPKLLPSYAGFAVEREVKELTKALAPRSPSFAIISGAKFETKEPILTKLLAIYDHVFVGGALANDFLQAAGHQVGKSLVSGADPKRLDALLSNEKLLLPVDVIVAPAGAGRSAARVAPLGKIAQHEAILDVGPETVSMLQGLVAKAKTILWNGPLGNYENGFTDGTLGLARAIAASAAYSVIGGGDTVAVVEELGANDQFSFVSTGGGAMLEFLIKGTLPGIRALGTR